MSRMVLIVICLGLTLCSGVGAAGTESVGVQCQIPWWQMEWNTVALGPIAQSFVAPADGLDFVDLMLAEGSSRSEGVSLLLVLHEGDLQGATVATSLPVELPDGFNSIARFQFADVVEFPPGETLTFEIVRASESGYAMVRGAHDDPCPSGHAWIEGDPVPFADLWFQAGRSGRVVNAQQGFGCLKASFGPR